MSVISLSFSSCSKDESDTSPELAGKWEIVKRGPIEQGQENLHDYQHNVACERDYVLLTNSTSASYKFEGPNCLPAIYNQTFIREGNILNFVVNGESEISEIVQLSNTQLQTRITEVVNGQIYGYTTYFIRK